MADQNERIEPPSSLKRTGILLRGAWGADLNGDGVLDLVGGVRPCLVVLLGTQKSGFVASGDALRPSPLFVGDSLTRLAMADFNNDLRQDVAVIRTAQGIGNISVLLGGELMKGLSFATTFTAGNEPTDLLSAELNGDKKPDLAVVSAKSSSLHVFLNKGLVDGSFGGGPAVTNTPADFDYYLGLPGYGPTCLASGDINQDGLLELAMCDAALPTIGVMFGRGGGGFEPPIRLLVDRTPSAIAIADLDGKGQLDLVVSHAASNRLTVFLNRSN